MFPPALSVHVLLPLGSLFISQYSKQNIFLFFATKQKQKKKKQKQKQKNKKKGDSGTFFDTSPFPRTHNVGLFNCCNFIDPLGVTVVLSCLIIAFGACPLFFVIMAGESDSARSCLERPQLI